MYNKGIFKRVVRKYYFLNTFDLGFGMSIPFNDQPMILGERIALSSKKMTKDLQKFFIVMDVLIMTV